MTIWQGAAHFRSHINDGYGGKLLPAISQAFPALSLRTGDSSGLGWSDGRFVDMPVTVPGTGTMVQYGSQPMVFTPSLTSKPGRGYLTQFNTSGQLIGELIHEGELAAGSGNPSNLPVVMGRVARNWASRHLSDLNATGGALNIGALPMISKRRYLYFEDGGLRAQTLKEGQRRFMSSVLGNEYGSPHAAFTKLRGEYIDNLAQALRNVHPSTAQRLNTAGIKDASFELVDFHSKRGRQKASRILLNASNPNELMPFGSMADPVGGTHHYNQYIHIPSPVGRSKEKYLVESMLHPLVAGSNYDRDLVQMAAGLGKKVGEFGTVARADVGLLFGRGAEFFWSRVGGDAGAMVTDQRLLHTLGSASVSYTRKIKGPVGMVGLTNPTTQLSPELLSSVPALKDFLNDPRERRLVLKDPVSFNAEALAQFKSGKLITAINRGDKIMAIEKMSDGLRLIMNRSTPSFSVGLPITVGGVRATAGHGFDLGGRHGFGLITQGLKSSSPTVVRERFLSHYAQVVLRKKGIAGLRQFARLAGVGIKSTSHGLDYLHTGSPSQMGVFRDPRVFTSEAWMRKMESRLGLEAGSLAPQLRKVGRKQAISMLVHGGRMGAQQAGIFYDQYRKQHGHLYLQRFEGQAIRVRATGMPTDQLARVRALEARQLVTKLREFGSDGASKLAGVISGNLKNLEDFVSFTQAGQVAPLMGNDAVQALIDKAGGKIGKLSLSDIQLGDDLARVMEKSLSPDGTGSLTPEVFEQFMNKLGMDKSSYGTFVDVSGTEFENLTLFSGARKAGAKDLAYGTSNLVYLPNLRRLIPEFEKASVTGDVGDIGVIPRRAVTAGKEAGEVRSLSLIANAFNAMYGMSTALAPGGPGKGSLEKRLWLLAAAARESLTGTKGLVSKKALTGFVGGRYLAQQYGRSGLTAGLTEEGIKRGFGGKIGERMIERLKAGQDVFAFYKRDPAQTAQQILPVQLRLVDDAQSRKAAGNIVYGALKGNVDTSETMWLSRLLLAASHGDLDSDAMNLYLPSLRGMKFNETQHLLRKMHARESSNILAFGKMIDRQLVLNDSVARRLLDAAGGDKLNTIQIAMAMAGGQAKWENVVSPFSALDKQLIDMGYKKDQIDDALRQALGDWTKQVHGKHIGVVHTYVQKQQDIVNALAGTSNVFNATHERIAQIKAGLGLGGTKTAQNAEYLRLIYGFLKKGTTVSESAMLGIDRIQAGLKLAPGSGEWERAVTSLAEHLRSMTSGVSGTGEAWYAFGNDASRSAAERAALNNLAGIEDPKFYAGLADQMMRVAKAGQMLDREGRTSIGRMISSSAPSDFLSVLMERMTGRRFQSTGVGGAGALAVEMSEYAISGSTIGKTTEAAVAGVGSAISRGGELAKDFASTKGWSGLKTTAVIGGLIAAANFAVSEPAAPPPPPYIPQSGMPPPPMVGFPNDGARPSALAPEINKARINRVPGQRRHFNGPESIFMEPGFDIMDGISPNNLNGDQLGSLPTTRSEALEYNSYSRDF